MAVVVNKDNPITGINEHQIDAIFSENRRCGASTGIYSWKDLTNNPAPINVYGHDKHSGTYGFFTKWTLCDGSYGSHVTTIDNSGTLIGRVAADINAIGYSGFNTLNDQVKALPVARGNTDKYAEPTDRNAILGQYPLRRFLNIYLVPNQDGTFKPEEADFIRFVLSQDGQALVNPAGFTPLSQKIMSRELERLNP